MTLTTISFGLFIRRLLYKECEFILYFGCKLNAMKNRKREIRFKGYMYGVIAYVIVYFIQAFIFEIENKWFPAIVALISALVAAQKLSEK